MQQLKQFLENSQLPGLGAGRMWHKRANTWPTSQQSTAMAFSLPTIPTVEPGIKHALDISAE